MKIRTEKDIEDLHARIKSELGVDVRKYENASIIENFVSLLVFPEYVLTWTVGPIVAALLLYILGYFAIDLVHVQYVLYGILGLVLFLLTGIFVGSYLLTTKMKADIWSIIDYSLTMTKSAVLDLDLVSKQRSPENKKEAYALLFKGILHIVTLPMLSKVISEKLPLVGRLINRFLRKIIITISDRINLSELDLSTSTVDSAPSSKSIQTYSKSMNYASGGMDKILNIAFGIARVPIMIGLGISGILLVLFLYLIH